MSDILIKKVNESKSGHKSVSISKEEATEKDIKKGDYVKLKKLEVKDGEI